MCLLLMMEYKTCFFVREEPSRQWLYGVGHEYLQWLHFSFTLIMFQCNCHLEWALRKKTIILYHKKWTNKFLFSVKRFSFYHKSIMMLRSITFSFNKINGFWNIDTLWYHTLGWKCTSSASPNSGPATHLYTSFMDGILWWNDLKNIIKR